MSSKLLIACLIASAAAQTPTATKPVPEHAVVLAWEDAINPAGTTYSVHRLQGQCDGKEWATYKRIAAGLKQKTYEDVPPADGTYCYFVAAYLNGQESGPSNVATALWRFGTINWKAPSVRKAAPMKLKGVTIR